MEGEKVAPEKGKLLSIYVLGIILWMVLIWYLGLWEKGGLGYFLIAIPPVIFLYSAYNISQGKIDSKSLLGGDCTSFEVLIIIIIINWLAILREGRFFKIIFVALVFLMLSILDVLSSEKEALYISAFKSVCQTISIALLMVALHIYYVEVQSHGGTLDPSLAYPSPARTMYSPGYVKQPLLQPGEL